MRSKSGSCYSLKTPSRHEWKSWTVGSYAYAWLPTNSHKWRNYPVLLVDIREDTTGEIQFIVAYLYEQHAAAQCLRTAAKPAQWEAAISLRSWPQGFKYVLSNHFDTVYEWELRTWSRSNLESITPHWAINIRTHRLEFFPGVDTDVALDTNTNPGLSQFLQMPCEIRDQIYNYLLLDERQQISRSYIYIRSLLLKRKYDKKGWPWHRSLSMPTLGPLPRLQAPNIFLVCKQIHTEALAAVYRTKTLVITVTSTADIFYGLDKDWSPLNICSFSRIRIDLILDCVTPKILQDCCSSIASLLQAQALSLQFLEVRIGFPSSEVSAGVRGVGFQLQIGPDDIVDSMQGFASLLQRSRLSENTERKPMQISWGINELQKSVGDYSCACIYLRARYLSQLWSFVCDGLSGSNEVASPALSEENCQDMGCKLVHH
jgi:hypothetical protein